MNLCMTKDELIAEVMADWREKRAPLIEKKNQLEACRRESVPESDDYLGLGTKIAKVNNQLGAIKTERKKGCALIKKDLRNPAHQRFELHSMRMTDDGRINWRLAYIPIKVAAERNWILARRMRKR
jgi:hypothetical protein